MSKRIFLPIILIFLISINTVFAQSHTLDAVNYQREIITERGWTNYLSVTVRNTGDADVSNVTIYFDGNFPKWFEVMTNRTELLLPGQNYSFIVKLSIPSDAEPKSYTFTLYLKSREVTSTKVITLSVFNTKADSMFYQVQKMESEIESVRMNASAVENSGKNVTGVLGVLSEAENYLDASKEYINGGKYQEATDLMINVEDLIKRANYDLSISPPKVPVAGPQNLPYEFMALPVIALVIVGSYVLIKNKRPTLKSMSKLKSAMVEEKKPDVVESQLGRVESSKKLIEDEFKENLISKESYDELMEKYEKTISDIKESEKKEVPK